MAILCIGSMRYSFWSDALSEALEDPKSKAFSLELLEELSFLEAEAANLLEDPLRKDL